MTNMIMTSSSSCVELDSITDGTCEGLTKLPRQRIEPTPPGTRRPQAAYVGRKFVPAHSVQTVIVKSNAANNNPNFEDKPSTVAELLHRKALARKQPSPSPPPPPADTATYYGPQTQKTPTPTPTPRNEPLTPRRVAVRGNTHASENSANASSAIFDLESVQLSYSSVLARRQKTEQGFSDGFSNYTPRSLLDDTVDGTCEDQRANLALASPRTTLASPRRVWNKNLQEWQTLKSPRAPAKFVPAHCVQKVVVKSNTQHEAAEYLKPESVAELLHRRALERREEAKKQELRQSAGHTPRTPPSTPYSQRLPLPPQHNMEENSDDRSASRSSSFASMVHDDESPRTPLDATSGITCNFEGLEGQGQANREMKFGKEVQKPNPFEFNFTAPNIQPDRSKTYNQNRTAPTKTVDKKVEKRSLMRRAMSWAWGS
ncbi:TPX2 central domain-containing protein [Pseudoscourfieldia marina]